MKKLITILTLATLALQAETFTTTTQVQVSHSTPEYRTMTKRVPYEECWDEQVPVSRSYGNSDDNSQVIGSLLGGAAGGIIGHQVGKGRGNTAATIGGAVIGSIIGNNLSRNNQYRYQEPQNSYQTQRRCSTRYTETQENQFAGYKNIAYYNGKKIIKISREKLDYIPISITVSY